MKQVFVSFAALIAAAMVSSCGSRQTASVADSCGHSEFKTEYITPTRIVLTKGTVNGADELMRSYPGQVSTSEPVVTVFSKGGSVLLDFGKEIQGGIQIVRSIAGSKEPARFRLCLGESVSEALSDVREQGTTATNEHSVRDFDISVPWLGVAEYGNSGFRFARLDYLGDDENVSIVAVRAIAKYRDIPYLGSFKSNDERLNQIWQTGAYTVHLNMQEYLWDGLKRDRLVWIGDM
ncbi:MAG: hypothetical protein J6N54_02680, partial [Bacteroidales bacterium]|nr:hypothetical protein [Bacteroidales bacterium]